MVATRGRFASDGERRLYPALVKVYGPHIVQGHVGMGDVVASEGMGLSDAELRYLRLAHFDFVIWDAKERAVAAWEYDGAHHVIDSEQQRRDRLKDSICRKAGLPLYRISGKPSVRTIRRTARLQAGDRTSLRARRLVGVLGAGLGNGLGLVLWWQAGQYVQPGVAQICWWPLLVVAIGPLVSYVTLMLVKGRYVVSAICVLPMQLLNGMLFFLTVSLLTIGFYLGWADGDSVTLLGAAFFLPYLFLAPLLIGTYVIRDAPNSAR